MNTGDAAGSTGLAVQRAAPEHVDSLVSLMRHFYAEAGYPLDRSWAKASFLALLSEPSLGCAWLAHWRNKAVGHAVLTVRYTMEHGALSGYVDDLFVEPEHRRQGVARALLAALFEECRARGCKSVQVEVGQSNVAARDLYAAFGLVPCQDGRMLLSGAAFQQ
jgi:GNAT superfamily N-acetyltransferase